MGLYTITVRDVVTGEVRTTSTTEVSSWKNGEWSCDCNRAPLFGQTISSSGVCDGAVRYVVSDIQPIPEYVRLEDLNEDYPEALRGGQIPNREQIARLLKDENPSVRRVAFQLLGQARNREGEQHGASPRSNSSGRRRR